MADELKQGEAPPVVPPVVDPPATKSPETLAEVQARLTSAEKALKDANHEAADRRKKLDAYEKAEADRTTAALSETEKLQKQVADANKTAAESLSKANERLLRAEVLAKASALGFADAADAFALIDRSKLAVGDDGAVAGADELLKALAAAKPYMLRKSPQQALHPGNPSGAADGESSEQAAARLVYGQPGSNVFDAKNARAHGGGVIVKTD